MISGFNFVTGSVWDDYPNSFKIRIKGGYSKIRENGKPLFVTMKGWSFIFDDFTERFEVNPPSYVSGDDIYVVRNKSSYIEISGSGYLVNWNDNYLMYDDHYGAQIIPFFSVDNGDVLPHSGRLYYAPYLANIDFPEDTGEYNEVFDSFLQEAVLVNYPPFLKVKFSNDVTMIFNKPWSEEDLIYTSLAYVGSAACLVSINMTTNSLSVDQV